MSEDDIRAGLMHLIATGAMEDIANTIGKSLAENVDGSIAATLAASKAREEEAQARIRELGEHARQMTEQARSAGDAVDESNKRIRELEALRASGCDYCPHKGMTAERDDFAKYAAMLLGAEEHAKNYLKDELVEPGRSIFWKLVDAIKATASAITEWMARRDEERCRECKEKKS